MSNLDMIRTNGTDTNGLMPPTSKSVKNMTIDARHKMIKIWRAIQKDQRELDFRKSEFSKDLRAHFAAGKAGDEMFHRWCLDNLGLQRNQTQELLARGVAATIVSDADTWNLLNGYKSIAYVRELPRKEQIAVIEAAKKSGYSIRTIMAKRGHSLPGYAPDPVVKSDKSLEKSTTKPQRRGVYADITVLANYMAAQSLKLPADVRVIVDMYKGQ
jgi:hypothetical protein